MDAALDHRHFPEYFAALWGLTPFAWQLELARRVAADSAPDGPPSASERRSHGPWPEAIALPTGAGKTACLDIAVFALAAQATRPEDDHASAAPRRIFFVVDRRLIVDEAHERARRLAKKLESAHDGILRMVADRLRHLARGGGAGLGDERPLVVHSLRGGAYRSETWARNPLQPTVVASTVDQIGSRLLFRAYGGRTGAWPVYAGLIANDSLVLLDEAHCSEPFLQTLRAVREYREWAEKPLGRCFHAVVMSATPPPDIEDVFRDSSAEGRDPDHPLGRRQLVPKPAHLRVVEVAHEIGADESAREAIAVDRLARELAAAARRLVHAGLRAVVVFANRVATARKTRTLLRGSEGSETEVILLTGRMRAVDREVVAERMARWDLHSSRSTGRALEKPVIVVATQTLEVGADLDFDGLVTECASLDALRQRFGRLNRMGRHDVESRAAILVRSDQARARRDGKDDPVYGRALTNTWNWLARQKRPAGRKGKEVAGEVDFGIAAMEALLKALPKGKDDLADLNVQGGSAPVMLPAHVDCWAQTSPEPVPSPDVALFLRGPETGVPDVHVCWRADLDLSGQDSQEDGIESLTLCPPSSGETLPVPIGVFRRWLAGTGAEDASADVPHAEDEGEKDTGDGTGSDSADAATTRRIVRWRGAQTSRDEVTATPGDLRPGDVIVIPTGHPGPWRRLGDVLLPDESGSSDALDVGDRSHRLARARPIIRLHPKLVSVWPNALAAKPAALALLEDLEQRYEDDPDEIADAVWALLGELAATDASANEMAGWVWLPTAARELREEFSRPARLRREYRIVGAQGMVLAGRRRIANLGRTDAFSDEDDTSASGTSQRSGRPVLLRSHLKGVEAFARRHAAACGLPDDLTEVIARAGWLHDIGKADPRFQRLLRAGSPWVAGADLAKSAQMPATREAWRRACETVGYPRGTRHELLTVRLAEESDPSLLPSDTDLRDLLLHLLASHHGYCRPFAPVVPGDDAPASTLELLDNGVRYRMRWSGPTLLDRLDSGVTDRFWRLTRRYGWWGLAWLESLLRLADWRRSEWEEAHDAEA